MVVVGGGVACLRACVYEGMFYGIVFFGFKADVLFHTA